MKFTIVMALLLATRVAEAAPPGPIDPDWPCQQIKVPLLSTGSMWTGPPPDAAMKTWPEDKRIADLVETLAERRVPLEQAQAQVKQFAATLGADRDAKLTALFAGLFQTLGQERSEVIDGLDRYGQRQKELAASIRTELEALRSEQDLASPDQHKLAELGQHVGWDTQVFNDRRQTLSYACQVPDTIAQRLFALARAIQEVM